MAYADRLGLWGEGTPFADKNDFIAKIQTGGLAAMELVARDMKAMGVYLARNISFDGVSYETVEHKLTPEQAQIYDAMAEGWQIVLQNMHKALELTGQNKDARARGSANAQFWAAQQRFFNQVLTSMQMPTVIERVKTDIKNGNAVVMQLVNTNEAAMNRRIAAMDEDQTLDEIDLTPRDMLMQYLDHSFPVQQYEEYIDGDGNKRARLVVDSHGNPVINKEALAIKEELLGKIGAMKVPDGPLEMVLNAFGPEMVAEITGRSRRIVKKRDEETGRMKKVLERRSERHRKIDTDAFMNDKKRILIFSDAGGTGRSYHADKTKKNQRKRIHYLIQPGWRADGAVQGFGRTHRSNQASAPHYVLVTTNLKGQKRFISSIARRLDQLGALTKGQRQTGGQGLFSAKDNLESDMARDALNRFYIDLVGGNIPDLNPKELLRKMGLEGLVDKHGNLNQKSDELRNITRFLNRVLSLDSSLQNQVFDEFASRLDLMVEAAINAGTLDFGLENYRADKVAVKQEQTIFVEEKSGAETKYFELDAAHKNTMLSYKTVMEKKYATHGFYRNTRSKRVYALRSLGTTTSASGRVIQEYWAQGQTTNQFQVITKDELDKVNQKGEPVWEKIPDDQAPGIWSEELEKAPKYRKEKLHLISGTLLPIWDRLPEGKNRVIRIKADDGRILLGRLIGERAIGQVLKRLGADAGKIDLTPQEIVDRILESGYTIHLANQWRLKRSRVSGENRIEIIGDDLWKFQEELEKAGTFSERIQFTTRFFIPTGDKSAEVLGKIIKNRPVVEAEAPAKATSPTEVEPEAKPEAEVKPAEPEAKGKPSEPFSMTNRTMQPFPTKQDPLSLFKKTIPKKHTISTLENLVVRNGIAYGTNLEITVAAKTDLEDGIYKITGREGSLRAVKVDGDLDEYPDMSIKIEEDAPRDVLDIGKLRPALQRSLDYVGDDKVRAVFKNISLTVKDGEMAIVASDTYRITIHKAKTNLPDGQYLINSDAVKLLLADKSISKAELVYGKKEVAIDTGNAVIFHRRLSLEYPKLTNVIPKEVKTVLLADKKDFLAKIKEVKEMKPGISPVAVFLTDKGLELKSHSSINNKEFTVVLPVKYFKRKRKTLLEPLNTVDMVLPIKAKSDEALLGSKTEDAALLNLNYVEKAVKHIEGSDAYMSFAGNHLSPVLFTGENPIGEYEEFSDTETLVQREQEGQKETRPSNDRTGRGSRPGCGRYQFSDRADCPHCRRLSCSRRNLLFGRPGD